MLAAMAVSQDADDPLSGLALREIPLPEPPPGWVRVQLRAAALNYHDLWSLRGVGLRAGRLPIVLGADGAGVDEDGNEVVVHPVIADPDAGDGDETLDPRRRLLSEEHDGTLAEAVVVPRRNLLPKPPSLSFADAAALPVAWGTAYRMLFTQARVRPGDRVLVQGAGGGVSTAAITMAAAAGVVVWVTGRTPVRRDAALALGAAAVFEPGARLPAKVDAVIETVGEATWAHSLRSLRPGGTVVVAGATTGGNPPADLTRVFFQQQRIVGSTAATRGESLAMLRFVEQAHLRPRIDRVLPLAEVGDGLRAMLAGEVNGKIVVTPPQP